MDSVGTILKVGDGIATIYGLEDAMAGELLEFPGGLMGMVLNRAPLVRRCLEQNAGFGKAIRSNEPDVSPPSRSVKR